ncbi:MAG TPA: hypothetical protein VNE62_05880 [Actinomycetota bacterium]|nr:hypothetical protein [Actinomycetota bacterium]
MKRVRAIAVAAAVLSATFVGTPARAANVSYGASVPALTMYGYFSDATYDITLTGSSGLYVQGSGVPPSVYSNPSEYVSMWIHNKTTGVSAYAGGDAAVVIDPALNAATASGLITNHYGTFVFSIVAAGTGTPQLSTSSGGPPYTHAGANIYREATTVATVRTPIGDFTGVGTGSLRTNVSTTASVTAP